MGAVLAKEIKHFVAVDTGGTSGFTGKLADGGISGGIDDPGDLLPKFFGGAGNTKGSVFRVTLNVIPGSFLTFITPKGF
jgi:hypothetical protein